VPDEEVWVPGWDQPPPVGPPNIFVAGDFVGKKLSVLFELDQPEKVPFFVKTELKFSSLWQGYKTFFSPSPTFKQSKLQCLSLARKETNVANIWQHMY
jgi:hypothetical protein